jgi:hypothetical protein
MKPIDPPVPQAGHDVLRRKLANSRPGLDDESPSYQTGSGEDRDGSGDSSIVDVTEAT